MILCLLMLASAAGPVSYHCAVTDEELVEIGQSGGTASIALHRGGDTLSRVISASSWELAVIVNSKTGKAARVETDKIGTLAAAGAASSTIYRLTVTGAGKASVNAAVGQLTQAIGLLPPGALGSLFGGEAPALETGSAVTDSGHTVG